MTPKIIIAAILLLGLLAGFPGERQTALAAEKTVEFTIPGCNT
jgi:hypothetical protein